MAPPGSEHLFSENIMSITVTCGNMATRSAKNGKCEPPSCSYKGYITFGTLTRAIRINDNVIKAWSKS